MRIWTFTLFFFGALSLAAMLALPAMLLAASDDEGSRLPEKSVGEKSVGEVILHRGGQMKTSRVYKIGAYCWVSWYEGIEKVGLRSNGTAIDGALHYLWEINRPGLGNPAEDRRWFDANCTDPPRA